MKKLHLLCNAHLDPAWIWRRHDGLAESISTFRVAADFCEQFDGYVFNHNESLLYEWVEEHEPPLFERIKRLVAEGKWHIMGGWYIQPDCVMPSGESFISQIKIGREYFKEKFGVVPKTAINFDSFGHTRGLAQILKLFDYDSYIVTRPGSFKQDFLWEGYDGSTVLVHAGFEAYGSLKGTAVERIKKYIAENNDKETGLLLWGMGNHGGGPSRIDLQEIAEFVKETDVEVIHSNERDYFAEIDKENLNTVDTSLIPCMVGCYTSMVRIKQGNRRLENKIAVTEKLMSYAALMTDFKYDTHCLDEAKKALAFCQFHDVLPGSGIKAVEDDALRTLGYGEEIVDRCYYKAFIKLCQGQKVAESGKVIPVMVLNPHPYEVEDVFTVDYVLENQNRHDDEYTVAEVYDEDGNRIFAQNEKSESTIDLDWAKKVSFHARVAPSSVTRFNCIMKVKKIVDLAKPDYPDDFITVKNDRMETVVNMKTGFIESYKVDGKTLATDFGALEVYNDNEDPWGMTVKSFTDYDASFKLMTAEQANEFIGYPDEKLPPVRVTEDGDARIIIQSFWYYKNSRAVVEYIIPKHDSFIDINVTLHSNEPNKMVKYRINTAFDGTPYGQTAFGTEALFDNNDEAVFQKWCAIKNDKSSLAVYNCGIYGGSFTGNTIRLSLLRTPIYSGHPVGQKPIAPHNRFLDHIDIGERKFSFRLDTAENVDKKAQIYNEKIETLSFFPSGEGEKLTTAITIDNHDVLLSSMRKEGDKYRLTLYNSKNADSTATVNLKSKSVKVEFGKYQVKLIEI